VVSTISRSKLFPYMVIPHLGKIDDFSTTAGPIVSRPTPFESPLKAAQYGHKRSPRQRGPIAFYGNFTEERVITLVPLGVSSRDQAHWRALEKAFKMSLRTRRTDDFQVMAAGQGRSADCGVLASSIVQLSTAGLQFTPARSY
jgi:hypothetical protein